MKMSKKKNKCNCTVYYLLGDRPQCLHRLFASGYITAVTRQRTPYGTKMYIWQNYSKKHKYQTGGRSQIKDLEQATLAVELAKKYNVERIEL